MFMSLFHALFPRVVSGRDSLADLVKAYFMKVGLTTKAMLFGQQRRVGITHCYALICLDMTAVMILKTLEGSRLGPCCESMRIWFWLREFWLVGWLGETRVRARMSLL
jgi:hypothetical protein